MQRPSVSPGPALVAVPSDHRKAVGRVRQMAWTLNELLELLLMVNQGRTEEP